MNRPLREPIRPGASPQLEYLGVETNPHGVMTVHVKRPGQLFGLALEQALRRIDEFKETDRARLLRALPDFYDIPACSACGFQHPACTLAQAGDRAATRRTKKSKSTVKEST